MYISLEIDTNTAICVDHTRLIFEKGVVQQGKKISYVVAVFSITTVRNHRDSLIDSLSTLHDNVSARQRIYTREFSTSSECEQYYTNLIEDYNDKIRQFYRSTQSISQDTLEKIMAKIQENTFDSKALNETFIKLDDLIHILKEKFDTKPKKPRSKRIGNNDVGT